MPSSAAQDESDTDIMAAAAGAEAERSRVSPAATLPIDAEWWLSDDICIIFSRCSFSMVRFHPSNISTQWWINDNVNVFAYSVNVIGINPYPAYGGSNGTPTPFECEKNILKVEVNK
jgi:hypothetical protein